MAAPSLGFVAAEPFSEATTPAFKASVMGLIDSVDTMILGANTYAQAKGYWPYADEDTATITRDPAATVRELKGRSGKEIWLWGSLKLMRFLLDAGRGHPVRKRHRHPALRGQEISGHVGRFDEQPGVVV